MFSVALPDSCHVLQELVLRFLQRAASNLQRSVSVTLPGRSVPIQERRQLLANQLGDFITLYNQVTMCSTPRILYCILLCVPKILNSTVCTHNPLLYPILCTQNPFLPVLSALCSENYFQYTIVSI